MKKVLLIISTLFLFHSAFTQKRYFTKTGTVSFRAGTAAEDIDGINKSATCVFDAASGQVQLALLVKGFEFKRSLMQEHFNENYLETDKYPKSTFNGKITNIEKVDFKQDGLYPVNIKGTLEIHGVKQAVETTGTFKVSGETVLSVAEFAIVLEDYKIEIPGLVKDKISKTARIKVTCSNTIFQ